ncbi:hypothetical protein FACS1894151_00270 [Spirochaetia bacterium]|nr:hypothetical protein FACS1894151_00270 [Spirochaetia bacterium]
MIALILQARLDSSRLPNKALLPLGGRAVLLRVMEALKNVSADRHILACPSECVREFSPFAEEVHFDVFGGSKDDVLARYCSAIKHFHADYCIRATGDNPFVFADAASSLCAEALYRKADYAGYGSLPYGAGVEFVAAEALLRAGREAVAPYDHEHVCPYLYGRPETFALHRPLAPPEWQGSAMRVTIDTPEDLDRAQKLYAALAEKTAFGEISRGTVIIAAYRALFADSIAAAVS